jgi:hypothetical protein
MSYRYTSAVASGCYMTSKVLFEINVQLGGRQASATGLRADLGEHCAPHSERLAGRTIQAMKRLLIGVWDDVAIALGVRKSP